MSFASILLAIAPEAVASAGGEKVAEPIKEVAKGAEESWSILKSLTTSDALQHIASSLVSFAFKLGIAILIFIVGKYIIKRLHRWITNLMTRRGTEPSLVTFISSLVRITLYFILIITIVGVLGLETSSFLAIFASAGVAIGLALSGTLQNFAGGVLILLLKPYKVGDFIEAQGFSGTVKEILIFNTIINTPDNKAIIIPNGPLSTSSINNYSLEEKRRVDWTVGVAYGTDFEKAKEIILSLLSGVKGIARDSAPEVYISKLADSSVNLEVRAWCETSCYWEIYFKVNELLYRELPARGIDFPYPQMDVHVSQSLQH